MPTKIEFNLSSTLVAGATEGLLLGDFNHWNVDEGIRLEKQADGSMKAILLLTEGKSYQYRYLLNDGRWVNDDGKKVQALVFGHAVENCLVEVPVSQKSIKKSPNKKQVASEKTVKSERKSAPKKIAGNEKNDLTRIFGITKKIAQVLKSEGIENYKELGKCTMKKLLLILDSANIDNKTSHYTSWTKQARLLDAGKTEEWGVLVKDLQK